MTGAQILVARLALFERGNIAPSRRAGTRLFHMVGRNPAGETEAAAYNALADMKPSDLVEVPPRMLAA